LSGPARILAFMDISGLDGILGVMCLTFLVWLIGHGPRDLLRAKDDERGGALATRAMVVVWSAVGLVGFSMHASTHVFWPPITEEAMAMRDRYSVPGVAGRTGAVAGFPWQGVEGCPDGAWSPGPSRWRTSAALWVNFACLCVPGLVIASILRRPALKVAWGSSFLFGAAGVLLLLRWMLQYRD